MIKIFDKLINYLWLLTKSVDANTRNKIERYKYDAMRHYGLNDEIRVRYKRLSDDTYARAVVMYATLDRYIDINVDLVSSFTDDWLEVLIWHEVAHHKEFDLRGELDDAHDHIWQSLMADAGMTPVFGHDKGCKVCVVGVDYCKVAFLRD